MHHAFDILTITSTTDEDESGVTEDTPHRLKRKKKLIEDENARGLRERNHDRLAQQAERRRKLLASQPDLGESQGDSDIIINQSKLDDQDFVYVNPKIGRRIKKHQIEGVRFLWNQIVTVDTDAMEIADDEEANNETGLTGCLLAHTMGLGKTMQV
jgi:SNF2 family DNA or RNA helicase